MAEQGFATHETMEVHELLVFKNVCMTKSVTMQSLVSDNELNGLLDTCAQTDKRHIEDLQGLLSQVQENTAAQ
ncbi:hypothetical protein [Alicyclobacillus dauci]|uniref:Spore coat protein n=1 Tax=Alicyclobacillus dauci TaxID=1475485 RepID=A0ABY6ZAA7_9BACL|nr:hypothetical protein [Alicyclobacillus dauci]WAH39457.1 hypothetical protein NZD86_23470 [Alicyclobacillus dauci]